ncbi:MAG: hypothetical protein ACRDQF_13105 [Thermocrispum sp.]
MIDTSVFVAARVAEHDKHAPARPNLTAETVVPAAVSTPSLALGGSSTLLLPE